LESASAASASRKSRSRKRSSSYTSDPCTPPRDTGASVGIAPVNNTDDAATELDQMLVADENNYINTQRETAPNDAGSKISVLS